MFPSTGAGLALVMVMVLGRVLLDTRGSYVSESGLQGGGGMEVGDPALDDPSYKPDLSSCRDISPDQFCAMRIAMPSLKGMRKRWDGH